jgi:hypothetical protein
MHDVTKSALLAILAQLGALGYSRRDSTDEQVEPIRSHGLSEEDIVAE